MKYITSEKYSNFKENLLQNLEFENPIEQLINSEGFEDLISNRKLPEKWNKTKSVEIMECMLYLLQDYEQYEYCQKIIKNWPELKK